MKKPSKYKLVKIDEAWIYKWFAMSYDDFDDYDVFGSKKAALRWIKKRQAKSQRPPKEMEQYTINEDGSITQDSSVVVISLLDNETSERT